MIIKRLKFIMQNIISQFTINVKFFLSNRKLSTLKVNQLYY